MEQLYSEDKKYRREIATLAVEAALEKKNYQKVADLVELADKYGVKKPLRYKAWKALAAYWMEAGHYPDALIAYNAARRIEPLKMETVQGLIGCLERFVGEYERVFSIGDLEKIEGELERILEFYKVQHKWAHPSIKSGRTLLDSLALLKANAGEAVETPATHRTDRIIDALHTNVSMDEVRADFARLITPYLLEELAEEEKKEPKKKKGKKAAKKKEPEKEETEG